MRWKDVQIPKWLDIALMVILSPLLLCVLVAVGLGWLDTKITNAKRNWIGPSRWPRRWWAWHVVRTDDGENVWLEWVWRTRGEYGGTRYSLVRE